MIIFQWSCDCALTCVGCDYPCFEIRSFLILIVIGGLIFYIINWLRKQKK